MPVRGRRARSRAPPRALPSFSCGWSRNSASSATCARSTGPFSSSRGRREKRSRLSTIRFARIAASWMSLRFSRSALRALLAAHELREREDPAERVVDLVRDAAGELADRRHLLGLEQPPRHLALLGDVLEDDDDAPSSPRTGTSGRPRSGRAKRSLALRAAAGGTRQRDGHGSAPKACSAQRSPGSAFERRPRRRARTRRSRAPPRSRRPAGSRPGRRARRSRRATPRAARTSAARARVELRVELAVQPLERRRSARSTSSWSRAFSSSDPELVDRALDGDEEVGVVPGLPDEAEDLGLVHRLLDGGGVGLPGEQDALDARPALLHDAQELDAGHPRHPVVGDDHLHGLARRGSRAPRPRRARRGPGTRARRSTRCSARRTCSSSSTTSSVDSARAPGGSLAARDELRVHHGRTPGCIVRSRRIATRGAVFSQR